MLWCAKPTSFKEPILEVGDKYYYSVDHSPSYCWDSATWEISEALLQFGLLFFHCSISTQIV